MLRTETLGDTKKLYVTITEHLVHLFANRMAPATAATDDVLPTFAAFKQRVSASKRVTVGQMWARFLCSAAGAPLCL